MSSKSQFDLLTITSVIPLFGAYFRDRIVRGSQNDKFRMDAKGTETPNSARQMASKCLSCRLNWGSVGKD